PVRKFSAACGRPAEEGVAEDLSRLSPWHAHHACGCPQPRPALVHQVLTTSLIHHRLSARRRCRLQGGLSFQFKRRYATAAFGPSRHFVAPQQFSRFRCRADITRLAADTTPVANDPFVWTGRALQAEFE